MSLRDKFKADTQKAENGVWISYDTNSDGTVPRFLIARMGASNPKYSREVARFSELNGDRKLAQDENKQQNDELFANVVMLGWENFQPEDDGVNLSYSRENVLKIMSDPAWRELASDWRAKALDMTKYLVERTEKVAKKS